MLRATHQSRLILRAGYTRHFEALRDAVTAALGARVRFTGSATERSTGWLEVTLPEYGDELLHSKKRGDGYIDQRRLDAIVGRLAAL